MMLNDNGPKDGDYVKYVAALEQVRQTGNVSAPVPMADQLAKLPSPSRPELLARLKSRQQAGQQAGHDNTTESVHTNASATLDAATKKSFANLIRALALAFVALVVIAPMLPEPFNVIVRLAAIFYGIYVFRSMRPALAVLRSKLTDIRKQQT